MVHFVGAGPGAADLITVRGAELLRKADIIIYAGSLVNRELLSYAPDTAKIYDSKDMNLQQIIEVMKDAEKAGLETVRLHTGEPSLYGAVREQMDELDKLGIEYDSCPGVSAAFGAAAALNLEYTLPEVSQSLIITRMEGRTGVPERESIESFAAHNASMAIYLSAGMLEELSARLINGGYRPNTPAAIVYKATWPEEKKFVTTIGQMVETAKKEGIRNHAVVLVGDAVRHEKYDKSKLYSDEFTTEYRTAGLNNGLGEYGAVGLNNDHAAHGIDSDTDAVNRDKTGGDIRKIIHETIVNRYVESDIFVFTDRAEKLADEVKGIMSDLGNCDTAVFRCRMDEAKRRLSFTFEGKRAAVFISATGIAVRAVADYVKDKLSDSPVIVISEDGRYVIPLLSGHMGGANSLATAIADRLGAFKVITTATDISGGFQLDNYAKSHQLHIMDRGIIKQIADISLLKRYDALTENDNKAANNKHMSSKIGDDHDNPDYADGYNENHVKEIVEKLICEGSLKPKKYYLGIGCRRGKTYGDIRVAVESFLKDNGIDISEVAAIASIDVKKDEEGIRHFANVERLTFVVYSAEALRSLGDGFSGSDKVLETVGVDNVCERAAVAVAVEYAGDYVSETDKGIPYQNGKEDVLRPDISDDTEIDILCNRRLVVRKTVFDGITLALAEGSWCGRKLL